MSQIVTGGLADVPVSGDANPDERVILRVSTDREQAVYHKGERVIFRVATEGVPETTAIQYDVQYDGVEKISSGKTKSGSEIEVKADRPGFIWLALTCGKQRAQAAAAIDPHLIKPTLPCPPDFKEYWAKKLAKLAATPINAKLKKIQAPDETAYQEWNAKWPVFGSGERCSRDIEVFEVEADIAEGNPVRGYFAHPVGAKPHSLPAVLFTHGAGIGDSDLFKTCAAAQHGYLGMDINAHGLLNGQPKEYYAAAANAFKETDGSAFKRGRLHQDTLYLAQMYLRHRRALDFLCARSEWNGRDLIVRGASQGGCLALACAGIDSRVSRICAGVPAMCDATQPYSLKSWFLKPGDSEETIAQVRNAVRYISNCNFAPDIKAEAYFTVAFLDGSCHPGSIYAAYNEYGGPKRIFNGPTATHSGIPSAIHYDGFTEFMLKGMSD